jgi:O-antigen/teichoic acid export membrane protein
MSRISLVMSSATFTRLLAHARMPLFRNGYALMLSSASTSALGMLYWMLATRLYTAEVVGLNAALISAMLLVSGIAQLGLASVLMRFLPRAGSRARRLVALAYLLALAAAALAGLAFVLGVELWAPALAFLVASPIGGVWFVLATMMWSIFTLQDGVLTGLKQTIWVPIENTAFSAAKIVLLLLCAWLAARDGIFASWSIPSALALAPVNYLIFRRLLPRHAAAAGVSELPPPRQLASYAAGNYVGSLLALAIGTLLPLLVLHRLGPRANAYFAQSWLIAASLQLVAGNMALSLTVEAASDRAKLAAYTRHAFVQTARLLLPLVAAIVAGAPYLLGIFGPEYAHAGTGLLRLLALGSLPNLVTMLFIGVARVQNRPGAIVAAQGAQCALALGLSYLWIDRYGIAGVGWAWVAGQSLVAAVIGGAYILPRLTRNKY